MKLFNKNPKKKNKPEPRPIPETSLEDEMLSEFSDGYNEFYVDESADHEPPAPKSDKRRS